MDVETHNAAADVTFRLLYASNPLWQDLTFDFGAAPLRNWIETLVDRLTLLGGGDVVFVQSDVVENTPGDYSASVVAFSPSLVLTYEGRMTSDGGAAPEVRAFSRSTLTCATLLTVDSRGHREWPKQASVLISYVNGTEFTLGPRAGYGRERVAELLPTLLRDLASN